FVSVSPLVAGLPRGCLARWSELLPGSEGRRRHLLNPLEHVGEVKLPQIAVLEFIPRTWSGNPRVGPSPHRIRRDSCFGWVVLAPIDEDPALPLRLGHHSCGEIRVVMADRFGDLLRHC